MDSLLISWLVIWAITVAAVLLEELEAPSNTRLSTHQWVAIIVGMLLVWPVVYWTATRPSEPQAIVV